MKLLWLVRSDPAGADITSTLGERIRYYCSMYFYVPIELMDSPISMKHEIINGAPAKAAFLQR